jgi:hypothetical protein
MPRRRRSLFRPVVSVLVLASSLACLAATPKPCESATIDEFNLNGQLTFAGEGEADLTTSPTSFGTFDERGVFFSPPGAAPKTLVIHFLVESPDHAQRGSFVLELEGPVGPGLRTLHEAKAVACGCLGLGAAISVDHQCSEGSALVPAFCEAVEGTLAVPLLERACLEDGFCVPTLLMDIDIPQAPGKRLSGRVHVGVFGRVEAMTCGSGSASRGGCALGNGNLT